MQRVSDWMSKNVASVRPGDDLSRVAQLCWERDIGWLPVLDEKGKLLGVVTDRDALLSSHFKGQRLPELRVESAMSRDLKSVMPQTTLPAALEVMARNSLRRLPVVDEQQRLVGVLTVGDVARATPKASSDEELVDALRSITRPRAGDGQQVRPGVITPQPRVAPSKPEVPLRSEPVRARPTAP